MEFQAQKLLKADSEKTVQFIYHCLQFLQVTVRFKSSVTAKPSPKKLDVKLTGELLNEIWNTRTRQNERKLDTFMTYYDMEFDRKDIVPSESNIKM